MPDRPLRLAAVQAAPVFLDRDATVDKACALIREAGASGADVIGFPEGFIPTHPLWYHFHAASSQRALGFTRRLSDNAVTVPGPETAELCSAAASAGAFVVMGLCERLPERPGTLFNSLLFIDEEGEIVGRHRKLVPTLGERLVHAPGDAVGLRAHRAAQARVGGLMCGENSNPLATFALDADGANVHVASWPSHFNLGVDMREIIAMVTRALAYQIKAFVINAVGEVSEVMLEELPASDEHRQFLAKQGGGACIIGPWGEIIAGPMDGGEGILCAEVRLDDLTVPKTIQDFGGHYNRFDLLRLQLLPGDYDNVTRVSASASPGVGGTDPRSTLDRVSAHEVVTGILRSLEAGADATTAPESDEVPPGADAGGAAT